VTTKKTPEKIGMIPALVIEEEPRPWDIEPYADRDGESVGLPDRDLVAIPISPLFRRSARVVAEVGEIDGDELKKSLENITTQLEKVLEGQAAKVGSGFRIEEFKVGLAVKGKGVVYFVGELGVEASIELTFKRTETVSPSTDSTGAQVRL
jgi:hypothetical protein